MPGPRSLFATPSITSHPHTSTDPDWWASGRLVLDDQTAETLPYCDCQVLLDRSYYAPVWDKSWPDDTLVEFDYIDKQPGEAP